MPRLSFDDPLPLGVASEEEQMRLQVDQRSGCTQVVNCINAYLPKGVRITGCRLKSEAKKAGPVEIQRFRIDLRDEKIDPELVLQFMESGHWPYHRSRHKGPEQTLDLRAAIKRVAIHDNNRLAMEIDAGKRPMVRPADFLMGVLKLTPEVLQNIVVTKLAVTKEDKTKNTDSYVSLE